MSEKHYLLTLVNETIHGSFLNLSSLVKFNILQFNFQMIILKSPLLVLRLLLILGSVLML